MVTVNGNSPAYTRMGELHFIDEDKNPIITLCYVQTQPIKEIDNFVLVSNSTLVEIQTDLNYHSSMCELVGIWEGFRHINKAINKKWCLMHINKPINRGH